MKRRPSKPHRQELAVKRYRLMAVHWNPQKHETHYASSYSLTGPDCLLQLLAALFPSYRQKSLRQGLRLRLVQDEASAWGSQEQDQAHQLQLVTVRVSRSFLGCLWYARFSFVHSCYRKNRTTLMLLQKKRGALERERFS